MTTPNHLHRFLQRAFARVGADYVRRLRAWLAAPGGARRPDLAEWVPAIADEVLPLLTAYWRTGAKRSLRSILHQLGRYGMRTQRSGFRYIVKDATGPRVEFAWDLFNRRIEQASREAVFAFCRSTLDTITGDVDAALAELHAQHLAGLQEGDTLREITARVQAIFDDPDRALRIAHTETARAVHAGQLLAADESGVVDGKRWLASRDACDKCLALAALGEVPLGKPFWVNPRGGPYAVVMAPPLHVNCFCGMIEVVNYDLVEGRAPGPLPGLAYRERLREIEGVL